jgi:hypothetical protein
MQATLGSFNPTTEHLMAGENGVLTAATNFNTSPKCCLIEANFYSDWDGVIDCYLPRFELDSLNRRPEESLPLHESTKCYKENKKRADQSDSSRRRGDMSPLWRMS